MQSSTTNFICPRGQHTGSQSSGHDLKWTRLNLFKGDPNRFFPEICHHYQSQPQHHSKQWKHLASPSPNTGMSAGKAMAAIFWDAEGELLLGYLDKGHTINGAFCADLLRQLRENIKQIRCAKLTRGVLFHQENCLVHMSTVALAAIQKSGFQLVEPYSPDLSTLNYIKALKITCLIKLETKDPKWKPILFACFPQFRHLPSFGIYFLKRFIRDVYNIFWKYCLNAFCDFSAGIKVNNV